MSNVDPGELQKYSPSEVGRNDIESLRKYKIGVRLNPERPHESLKRDIKFLFGYVPERIKKEFSQDDTDPFHLLNKVIYDLKILLGQRGGQVVEMNLVGGEYVPAVSNDNSEQAVCQLLLEKFEEIKRLQNWP